jgi:exopolyphosphatase/guanosine-5'-triphosphate,3'-diphosphate pyrophosphatase
LALLQHSRIMTRLAAIDLGSLTVRLAMAEVAGPGDFTILRHCREITGLGQGLAETGNLAPEPMARTLVALEGFVRKTQEFGATRVQALATQAVRQAANQEEFLSQVEELGIAVRLLSPEEEARLTLKGVLSALDQQYLEAGPLVVFDVGGGSSEFVLLRPEAEPWFAGLPLGVLTLSQACPVGDPPEPDRVAVLEQEIRESLQRFHVENFTHRLSIPPILVGTAGAVTTLAAMALEMTEYAPKRVNNLVLQKSQIARLASHILALPEAARARLPGLEAGKAGVMVAGVLIILNILRVFGRDSLVVIDAGLLEGLLSQMAV